MRQSVFGHSFMVKSRRGQAEPVQPFNKGVDTMTNKRKLDKDADFEIRFYEGILQHAPEFIEALIALGDLYTRKGWYGKGLDLDRKLSSLRPEDPFILYNLACSYSLVNDIARSLATIKFAIRLGYDHLDYLEKDPDLVNLRQDQRFKDFIARLRKKGELQTK